MQTNPRLLPAVWRVTFCLGVVGGCAPSPKNTELDGGWVNPGDERDSITFNGEKFVKSNEGVNFSGSCTVTTQPDGTYRVVMTYEGGDFDGMEDPLMISIDGDTMTVTAENGSQRGEYRRSE